MVKSGLGNAPQPVGARISGNAIYANGGIGINLVGGTEDAQGVTANDPGDGDTGPNYLQNYPVITSSGRRVLPLSPGDLEQHTEHDV